MICGYDFYALETPNFFNWLLVTGSDFCLNHADTEARENLQRHRLSDNSSLHAGLYVFRPRLTWDLGLEC